MSNLDTFFSAVLTSLQAPVTPQNLAALDEWARWEGGGGANNPLNTTTPESGSTLYNIIGYDKNGQPIGVQNFPDQQTGVNATVATLNNGYYPSVVAALRVGNGLNGAHPIPLEIDTWGTHGFATFLRQGNVPTDTWSSGGVSPSATLLKASPATYQPGINPATGKSTTGGGIDLNPADWVSSAIKGLATPFEKAGELFIGFALVLVGLFFIAKTTNVGANVTNVIGKVPGIAMAAAKLGA